MGIADWLKDAFLKPPSFLTQMFNRNRQCFRLDPYKGGEGRVVHWKAYVDGKAYSGTFHDFLVTLGYCIETYGHRDVKALKWVRCVEGKSPYEYTVLSIEMQNGSVWIADPMYKHLRNIKDCADFTWLQSKDFAKVRSEAKIL